MILKNWEKKFPLLSFIALVLFLNISCGPKINSFSVEPRTITTADTVRMNWDAKGKPTILFHEKNAKDERGKSLGAKYLDFTLVVEKGTKEKSRPVQVVMLPDTSSTEIVFATDLKGDTLVAAGTKNVERWGSNFEITSVASASNRPLTVIHANRKVALDKAGTPASGMNGTPVEGPWEIRSLLTAAEKKDMSNAPEKLRIITTIKYKRR